MIKKAMSTHGVARDSCQGYVRRPQYRLLIIVINKYEMDNALVNDILVVIANPSHDWMVGSIYDPSHS